MSALSPFLMMIISIVVGMFLAFLAIMVGTSVLVPTAQQSDSPLIVYGDEG